jgi:hypothetical protein
MFLNLLHSYLIAMAATMLSPAARIMNATMLTQSSSSSPSVVELAARTHKTWFIVYVVWIVVAALASAALTFMLWRSGNRQQDAVIEETKTEQKRLDIDLANAKKAQAVAEKSLLELQRLIKEPRTIDRKRADEILDWGQKGSVSIFFSMLGDEPGNLARQLAEILYTHGWQIQEVTPAIVPAERPGVVIRVYGDTKGIIVATNWTDAPEPAKTLHRLLAEALVGNPMVETRVSSDRAKDRLEVTIGGKY